MTSQFKINPLKRGASWQTESAGTSRCHGLVNQNGVGHTDRSLAVAKRLPREADARLADTRVDGIGMLIEKTHEVTRFMKRRGEVFVYADARRPSLLQMLLGVLVCIVPSK